MWWLHQRLEEDINEKTCKPEIQSFLEHGQFIPVLGRRLQADPTHEVELIYGSRRLFVARHLNLPLLIKLSQCSDREGIIAMNLENEQRTDISAYERGLNYARWLRAGHFASQEDLAQTLKMSPSQVSRYLQVAQLPRVIVDAFGGPGGLPKAWGVQLAQALKTATLKERCVQAANRIVAAAARPTPAETYRTLLAAADAKRQPRASARDKVIKDEAGASLFRIRSNEDSVSLIVPMLGVPSLCFQEIESAIDQILNA